MKAGRAQLEQPLAQARDDVEAEFLYRSNIGDSLDPLAQPTGISTPVVAEKRARRSKFVMGMMLGTIGSVTPRRAHASTNWT